MRVIGVNIRTESGALKDVQAMIAVWGAGLASSQEIPAKYGRETVLDTTRVYMEQSERCTRAELARIPGRPATLADTTPELFDLTCGD
jgi:N-methylhydantoinase B/oxoprolinase/acetone carboxylase alpha subunit